MLREIALDTETTGFDPSSGHRVVEIGCVEMINHVATDQVFHRYLNPERAMPQEAFAVHGLSDAFLADKPRFVEIVDDFLAFVGEAPLVIHNAAFDLGFLNAELQRLGRPPLANDRGVDTIKIARQRFPGAPASLDALCKRFEIDLSERGLHGALTDAKLLARVYLELRGGRQPDLVLVTNRAIGRTTTRRATRQPRLRLPSEAEAAAHAAFVQRLANPLWLRPRARDED